MQSLETRTMAKVSRRLIPLVIVCFFVAYLDRVNLSFAALEMNKDLNFSPAVYGFGAGVFSLSYLLLEMPSNLILVRVGARRWIARIMLTWGLLSGAMAFITGETSFYVVRFLLGAAEAGFFPGILFYLTLFFPAAYRGRMVSMFTAAIPLSGVIGAPVSTLILSADGILGLKGWQWVFITEAIPALVMAAVVLLYMTDQPSDAKWLDDDERAWLVQRQSAEQRQRKASEDLSVAQVLVDPRVLAFGVAAFGIACSIYGLSYFLPQIVKAFELTNMQTGLVSAIPFLVGSVGMVWYGRRSDRLMERRTHCAAAFLITAVGLVATALLSSPLPRLLALSVTAFGAFSVVPVFWSMPTAFLSGAAAAAGLAYINSISGIAGFVGPFVMGWIREVTGSFNNGLLLIAVVCNVSAFAVLCIGQEKRLKQTPAADDVVPMPGRVADVA